MKYYTEEMHCGQTRISSHQGSPSQLPTDMYSLESYPITPSRYPLIKHLSHILFPALELAMGLRNASHSILERAQNVSQNVNSFLDMLNDLLNQSAVANNNTDEANAILARNTPPKFQVRRLID